MILIGTWDMAEEGLILGNKKFEETNSIFDAIEEAIKEVERDEEFTSVGKGGLPNEEGILELDAAMMDGKDLSIGAVMSLKNILHPISVARLLMKRDVNNILSDQGAFKFAIENGFKKENLLTEKANKKYLERKEDLPLNSYIGHDTVCIIGLDDEKNMAVGTSTSGLFYKKSGRVGDSPFVGSGFYVDNNIGGAAATGLGEDIMKGCISFKIVELMRTHSPSDACEIAVKELNNRLEGARDISVIALNNKGEYGAATNIDEFPFVVIENKEVKNIKVKKVK